MHASIIQLSETPILLEDDGITKEQFFSDGSTDSPIWQVADFLYDEDDVDRDEDIKSLLGSLPDGSFTFTEGAHMGTEDEVLATITFHDGFKEAYFESKIKAFLTLADELKQDHTVFYDATKTYKLRHLIEDKCDYYIYLEENRYESPLDRFVRDYMKTGQPYYIGSTVGYHC